MFGLLKKGIKTVAQGRTQEKMGLQSPQLAGGVVRIGRFLYVVAGSWIAGAWYTGFVNKRTQPGEGPKLIWKGKVIGPPDRPNNTPSFLANLHGTITGQGAPGQVASGLLGVGGALQPGAGRGAFPGSPGRTDQGVDFGGVGAVRALVGGKIIQAGSWPGWPTATGDGLVYSTPRGNFYIMENFRRAINPATGKPFAVGDTITAGQIIGQALGGSTGIEAGYANAAGTGPLTPYNGANDGTAMPGGLAFRKLLGYN